MKSIASVVFLFVAAACYSQNWMKSNAESMRLYQIGDYRKAIEKADEALIIAETQFGRLSDQFLSSLSNKGYALAAAGNYESAVGTFRNAVYASFQLYQKPTATHMQTLSDLAKGFMEIALYDSVEHYLTISRYIFNAVPTENKAHYDSSAFLLLESFTKINSIEASLRHKKGQVDQAIVILKEQLSILEELHPEIHMRVKDYQTTVNNLATYYNEVNELPEARKYARIYYDLVREDSNSLDYIYSLQNLASIYRNSHLLDSATYFWKQALQVLESTRFKGAAIHSVILNNLGEINLEKEDYQSSIDYLLQSLNIQMNKESINPPVYQTTLMNLAESYRWSGNYQMADSLYSDLIRDLLKDVSQNFTYLSDNEKLAFYKKQVIFLENYASFALEISGLLPLQDTDTPYIRKGVAADLYNLQMSTKALILNASRRMKNAILQGQDSTLKEIYTLWLERKNQFAQGLANGSMDTEELKWLEIKIEENEKWLSANSRSFRSGFKITTSSWRDVQGKLKEDEAAIEIIRLIDGLIYGALIVTPETRHSPAFALVMSTQSKHLEREFFSRYANSIQYKVRDTSSYSTYWRPVISEVIEHMPLKKMPGRVYVSNDGIYNQINLNSLYNWKNEGFVIDETEIVLVTNTRELLEDQSPAAFSRKRAALFGRPTFSADSTGFVFEDLPGSGKEVELIRKMLVDANWSTQIFMNDEASEANIKKLVSPKVLHLASHGFFDPKEEEEVTTLASTLMRSGIALTNINKADDGLLTAYEVTSLNLDSTELVVLSACETAKGVSNHGEGVYGLQRALEVAGVQNMVMSLWKVDDEATQLLMVNFYEKWIQTNDLRSSFISAQKELRQKFPEPYYWGAFILAGR